MKIIRMFIIPLLVISSVCAMEEVSNVVRSNPTWSGTPSEMYEGEYQGQHYSVVKMRNIIAGNVNKGTLEEPHYETLTPDTAKEIWSLFEKAEAEKNTN